MTKWPKGRAVGLGVAALLVAVGAALLGTAGLVSSFDGASVSIEGKEIVVGGSETTRLEAFDVPEPGVCIVTVDVTYDPEVKEPTECDADPDGLFDQVATCTIDLVAPNTIRFGGMDTGADTVEGVTGDIPLADITWDAVGSAGASTKLGVTVVTFRDCNTEPISVTAEDGTNTIVSPTPTPTATPTATSPAATDTPTPTPTPTPAATNTPTPTATTPATGTATGTPTATETPPTATGTPPPPTATATPPTATGTPPTSAIPAGGSPTPKVTPAAPPPTGGGGLGPLSDLPWVTALAAGAVLAWVLAAAGVFHTVRRRAR